MMNNEATHVKTQEDYSKFSSIVSKLFEYPTISKIERYILEET